MDNPNDGVEMDPPGVWELTEDGARLLYAAGTPEYEAWVLANAVPHDLEPLEPVGQS